MNEAERYLERKNKNGSVEPGVGESEGNSVRGGNPNGNVRKLTSGSGSSKGWSVGLAVFGVAATMFWMLFFKSCFARF